MKSKIAVMLFLFLRVQSFVAQQTLTFEQVITTTLENNFDVRIERINANQVANNNNIGSIGYLPRIGLNVDQFFSSTDTKQVFFSGQTNQRDDAKNQSLSANLRLDWTFFDGFAMFARQQRFDLQSEQAKELLKAKMEMSIYQASILYYTLVFQQKMSAIYEASIQLSKARYSDVVAKKQFGAATEIQLLQAKLDLNADSSNQLNHAKTIQDLKIELKTVMGNKDISDFQVVEPNKEWIILGKEELFEIAKQQNTSYLLQKGNLAIIDSERKEMVGRYYPQLSLYGQYAINTSQSQVGILASNRSLGPGVGITLRWTILDQLSNYTQLKNALLEKEKGQIQLDKQAQIIQKEIDLAYGNYTFAQQLVQLEKSTRLNTTEIFDIAEKTYKAGAMTALELREIQFSIIAAENRQLAAELALKTAQLNLNLLSGSFKNLMQ